MSRQALRFFSREARKVATSLTSRQTNQFSLNRSASRLYHASRPLAAGNYAQPLDTFSRRHIGPQGKDREEMLKAVGVSSLDELVESTIPGHLRFEKDAMTFGEPIGEQQLLRDLKAIASKNKVFRSHIGMGYYDTVLPNVILRNVLENPNWYTAYTPYQAEIAQGRLESLLNYQTMVSDLTGLEVANASLLDEATAAAEAMNMMNNQVKNKSLKGHFFADHRVHPQTIAVCKTRAAVLGIEVTVGDYKTVDVKAGKFSGVLVQYPATDGQIDAYDDFVERVHAEGGLVAMATDLLALTKLRSPGEIGADVALGSAQRFGVPMGYGGPHAAFFASHMKYHRQIPGRIIGMSKDSRGQPALRMAMQTREQHIRREKATSNICTAQALLANIAAMYAIYHGPEGLKDIADRTHAFALALREGLKSGGFNTLDGDIFDTVTVNLGDKSKADGIMQAAAAKQINLRRYDETHVSISVDETTQVDHLEDLFSVFGVSVSDAEAAVNKQNPEYGAGVQRTSPYMTHEVFHSYHSETELLRYINRLSSKDLGLGQAMIPLGSCTMKLNATTEMIPITWPEFANLHPFCPKDQAEGYHEMFDQLISSLSKITGFHTVSLQPNSGAQGEYAGLRVIQKYHEENGEGHRNICLIPTSAHGTNPASAALCGLKVVPTKSDADGNVDLDDLRAKAEKHKDNLASLMVTYPSTHGVFEETIMEVCKIIHDNGGQVYMDGANMNAQCGFTSPGYLGADVCHLNLHKTFCIPHGGGGPGVGPIGVAKHLAPFLPGHVVVPDVSTDKAMGAVSAAPYGSSLINTISWAYIHMMGDEGIREATAMAILNANYIVSRIKDHYKILYLGGNDRCAHEFIIDLRALKNSCGIEPGDVAKRLMDYGFHAPTMSWPVTGTLMCEPTESESKYELDRFCDALIQIRQEIRDVEEGKVDPQNNVLKHSPHTMDVVGSDSWDRPYDRELAAYPVAGLRQFKFWPSVGRIDDVFGDRNLICSCPPMSAYEDDE